MSRLDERAALQEQRLKEWRCIYCGSYHVWCKCSWWTLHKVDVFMICFGLALGLALLEGLWML